MALKNITREMVVKALKEFDRLGREEMLERYSVGPRGKSTRWYIHFGDGYYDQKLILRAAHELAGLGVLPPGRGTFTAAQARRRLKTLKFKVVGDVPVAFLN